jgi:hypothetical protein
MDQHGNRVVVRAGGGVFQPAPGSFLKQANGQMFKDDVTGFSSTSNFCFILFFIIHPEF